MEIQLAVAKINKFGSSESGDTIEVVERPNGGISVVLAGGAVSGHDGKTISSMVVRKVIALLAEGVRDGAAARAASDSLYTERDGASSSTLNILSVDFQTNTVVISRNNPAPIFLAHTETIDCLNTPSYPVGNSRNVRPNICEVTLKKNLVVILYTIGLTKAGETYSNPIDLRTTMEALLEEEDPPAQYIADTLLSQAIRLDQSQPQNDMSIVVMRVSPNQSDPIRRLTVRLPIP